ncbi:MAG: MGMT family protein [Chthoniobacterales bacterium]
MPTPFQEKVYEVTRTIPRGHVVSYKTLAEAVGCRAPRAIGQAMRANPYAPGVPCHRVIAADRTLGGFGGDREGEAITRKIALLRSEGVTFDPDGRVNAKSVLPTVP